MRLAAAFLALVCLTCAPVAHAQILLTGLGPGASGGAANPCANTPLNAPLPSGAAACFNNTSFANAAAIPGYSASFGAVSGAGAGGTDAPDGAGGLVNVASGSALTNSQGLLGEPATENDVKLSNAFTGAPWSLTDVTRTANSATDPLGTTTSNLLTATGAFAGTAQALTLVTGTPMTCSVWAKAAGAGALQQIFSVSLTDVGSGSQVEVGMMDTTLNGAPTLTTTNIGDITLTGFSESSYSNGLKRFVMNFTQTTTPTHTISLVVSPGNFFAGTSSTNTIDVFGAQCGPGAEAFYLPNSSASAIVQRTADSVSLPNPQPTMPAEVTFNGSHLQQVLPASTISLTSNALAQWTGRYGVSNVSVAAPFSVPALAAAQGYNVLTDYIAPGGYTADNVDLAGSLATGFQEYIPGCFGQSATSFTGELALSGGNLQVGGSTNFMGGLVSASCKAGAPGYVGQAFGGGFYVKQIVSMPIAGAAMNVTVTGGTTLTVNSLSQGAIVPGGSQELWISNSDTGVNIASGTGPYTLSGSIANQGPVSATAALVNGLWNAPIWFYSVQKFQDFEAIPVTATNFNAQWPGQAQFYEHFFEHDGCEDFFGRFGDLPYVCVYTGHDWWANPNTNTNHAFNQTLFSSTSPADVTYEAVEVPATPTTPGSFSQYYNGVLNGANSWSQFVQFQTTAATAPSTASANITLAASCPSNVAAAYDVVDTTISPYAAGVLGLVSTCVGTALHMAGNSAVNGAIADHIVITPPPPPSGKAFDMGIIDLQQTVIVNGCTTRVTFPCLLKGLWVYQPSTAGNVYH